MKQLHCATYVGIDAHPVSVESTLTKGLPSFNIVGMANAAITESKERVKSALLSNDFVFPPKNRLSMTYEVTLGIKALNEGF